MVNFRFQELEIWKDAIDLSSLLFDIADGLEKKKFYRFADQLRGASLSITDNIAEVSGSTSKKEFVQFLNIARRSAFENANILIVLERRKLISREELEQLLNKLDHLCRKITNFKKSLSR
jgi:four helix bundle protein